ncbi:hypothetical protein MNAN1_000075 [Malassezia nana]|uniref:Nucleoporin Nup54 alpha-helical domain-containing protein n=1 Tax=Malassezia nana TaxID=180528 RepID=A0AAF0EN28_9BASI|nr:hypothetical protein MNAN1_000075 [Malassezia nana]
MFGTSSMGSQPAQPSSTGVSFFGNQANQQNKPPAAPSGNLFGSSTGSAPGSLFGNAPTNATGAPFGQSQGTGTTTGLFGQPAAPGANGATTGTAPGAQNQGTGGLFGASQPQGATGGGLFGANSSQPNQGGGLFGNTQTTQSGGLFGASQTQPASGGLFGASQTQPASGGLFGFKSTVGESTTNPTGSSATPFNTSQTPAPSSSTTQAQDQKLGAPLNAQLERIALSWDTSNLNTCQFQYYLYNRAPDAASQQRLCIRRPDAVGPMHDALWAKALQENPEPDRLYPVLAVGFGDLQTRANAQMDEATRQRNKVAELAKQLATLQQKHDLSNAVRAQTAMMAQTRIHQRLLSLAKDSSVLIPALRGQSLTATEDLVKASLENCEAQLNGATGEYITPSEHVHLRAQLNSLWAQLGVVRARREAMQVQNPGGGTAWVVVDDSSFDEIANILSSLQQGLVHLANTLTADSKALDIVCEGLKGVPLVGVRHR